MAITNMGELKAEVADWLNREDLTSKLPGFIALAQSRINKDVRLIGYDNQYYQAVSILAAQKKNPITVTAPGNDVSTLVVDGNVIPYATNEAYWHERNSEDQSTNGVWTLIEGNIHYSKFLAEDDAATPTGDGVAIELIAHDEWVADPVTDGVSGWVVTDQPDIALFASLVEATIYLKDMQMMQVYQARYDELCNKYQKDYKRRAVMAGMSVSSVGGDYAYERQST